MTAIQVFLTPAAGKRLIARALANRPDVQCAAREHTVVIVAVSYTHLTLPTTPYV